jgi:hypothetical protein
MDDLPDHVKGTTHYYHPAEGFSHHRGYYFKTTNPATQKEADFAIEFIRNQTTDEQDWYICQLEEDSQQWSTEPTFKVERNTLGLGW